jgi:hypothetical protein
VPSSSVFDLERFFVRGSETFGSVGRTYVVRRKIVHDVIDDLSKSNCHTAGECGERIR